MKKFFAAVLAAAVLIAAIAGCTAAPAAETAEENADLAEKFYTFSQDIPDADIEAFAAEIRDAFVGGDWQKIADNANFPLRVGEITCDTAEDFLAQDWDSYFSEDFISEMKAETCHEMGFNGEGFMLANGLVWVFSVADGGSRLVVWSVNA